MNEYKKAAKKRYKTIIEQRGKNAFSEISKRAAITNRERYGQDYYKLLGKKGGRPRKGKDES